MREIEKTRTRTECYKVYEANDGTEFDNAKECQVYEKSAKCVLFAKYRELIVDATDEESLFYVVGCVDNRIDIVKVNTEKDADLILQILLLENPQYGEEKNKQCFDRYSNRVRKCIGNENDRLIVFRGYDNESFYPMTTYNEFVEHIHSACFKETDNGNKSGRQD